MSSSIPLNVKPSPPPKRRRSKRHHHILDPRTGFSAPSLASATVTAPSAMLADGLATAAMAMPSQQAVALLEQSAACEGYLVTKTAAIIQTSGFSM